MNICRKDQRLLDVISSVEYKNGRNIFVTSNDILIGVVSQGDIIRHVARNQHFGSVYIHELMNLNPIKIMESDVISLKKIINVMKGNRIDEIPVVGNRGELKKVIQIYDILGKS